MNSDECRPTEAGALRRSPAAPDPAFLLLLDPPLDAEGAVTYRHLARSLSEAVAPILGLQPRVEWHALPEPTYRRELSAEFTEHGANILQQRLTQLSETGAETAYVLPVSFDFGLAHKEWLNTVVRGCQRAAPGLQVHYDEVDPAHPLLVQAFVDQAVRGLQALDARGPGEVSLLLIAGGAGDADTRAHSYRLMRLIWEQLGVSRGDVAFVRHPLIPLPEQVSERARVSRSCICVGQFLWPTELSTFARLIFSDTVGQFAARGLHLTEPPGGHPNVQAWLAQRMVSLQRAHRKRIETRTPSARYLAPPAAVVHCATGAARPLQEFCQQHGAESFGPGLVAELSSPEDLRALLRRLGVPPGRTLVKPTWHGYARGTYTDPPALDLLLNALQERAILVEGHTSSRNDGVEGLSIDWEDGREHRVFIQQQDQQFLERTGLRAVLQARGASYLNVTESWWDGQCAPAQAVLAELHRRGAQLHHEELARFVPQALFDLRGAPVLSYARFKGPTRLATSNLFGLLPPPLRAAWHGPNITYFARVCCDLAKLYGTLFKLYGVVESFHVAVRWDRQGIYRSRWGNYDLVPRPGVVCLSEGTVAADVLASRLQGQDVKRSAFFDVVDAEFGIDERLVTSPLPATLLQRFA